ncbi:MAG: hypothetical protein ACI9ZV_000118 [Candidatus Azotimanducaceae bacterium]|jgi:hypothetical protein
MKVVSLLTCLLCCAPLLILGAPLETGQTSEQVIEGLGKPMGRIELRDKVLLLYPQGEVTLRQGKVAEIDLMSEEQFAADQERLRVEREEWLIDQAKLTGARIKQGEALRTDKMKSVTFAALPAKARVDYWRSFQIRYPQVDVSPQIATSLERSSSELEELRNQQRIAELEARVALAEKETAAARLETEKLREATERTEHSRNYGLRYTTDPVINNSRYYYRPPAVTIYTDGHSNTTSYRNNNVHRVNGVYDSRSNSNQRESVAERAARILNQAKGNK